MPGSASAGCRRGASLRYGPGGISGGSQHARAPAPVRVGGWGRGGPVGVSSRQTRAPRQPRGRRGPSPLPRTVNRGQAGPGRVKRGPGWTDATAAQAVRAE